ELGEVRLEPVLLRVLEGRILQVTDHLVDVVLQGCDLAARLDRDRARQIALGHRGRHLGDGAHLRRQVGGELVHVVGQMLPRARRARHARLAPELPLDTNQPRHRRHLIREGGELVDHAVDGVREGRDLALPLDRSAAWQVALPVPRHTAAAPAVVTAAMLRTWPVRLPAMKFTLSVRSFHVPATPGTTAWPPRMPSVPTSRATRVTSEAKARS